MTDESNDEQFYRDTESTAFPKHDDRQLALLEPLGKRRTLQRGEFIFKAGQRDLGLTVILRGEIEVFEAREGREQILATGRERDFIGDVAMLQGTSALATSRVKSEEAAKFWKFRRSKSGARSPNCLVWVSLLSAQLSCAGGDFGATASSLGCASSRWVVRGRDISSMIFSTRIISRIASSNLRVRRASSFAVGSI